MMRGIAIGAGSRLGRARRTSAIGLLSIAMAVTTSCRLIAGFTAPPAHDVDTGSRDLRDDGGVPSGELLFDLQHDGPLVDAPAVDFSPFDGQGTDSVHDALGPDTTLVPPHFKWMTPQTPPLQILEVSFKSMKRFTTDVCVPYLNFYFGKDDLTLGVTARCPDWTMVNFWGTRKAVTDDFSQFVEIPGVDRSAYREESVTFSNDTLSLYVMAAEILPDQSSGSYILWHATRAKVGDDFSSFRSVYSDTSTGESINDIILSADQKRLYWAQHYRNTQSKVFQRIVFSELGAAGSPLLPPTVLGLRDPPLPPDQLDYGDADPSLTASERVIVFVSNRGGAASRLWYATRLRKKDLFGKPKLIPGLQGYAQVSEPGISRDGKELFFCTGATPAGASYTCHHLSTR